MKRTSGIITVLVLLLCASCQRPQAIEPGASGYLPVALKGGKRPMADYYVDNSGADGDGTLGSPWNNIANHINDLNPGDVMHVMGDPVTAQVYTETVTVTADGSDGSPITIQPYSTDLVEWRSVAGQITLTVEGDYLTVNGKDQLDLNKNLVSGARAIAIEGDYCEILDAEVRGVRWTGRMIKITGDYARLSGLTIHDSFNGNSSDALGVAIDNGIGTIIEDCYMYDIYGDCVFSDDDPVTNKPREFIIRNNTFEATDPGKCCENAIDLKGSDAAAGWSEVYGNTCSGFRACDGSCGGGGDATGEAITVHNSAYNVKVYDNVITDCTGGIVIDDGIENVRVYGNIFYNMNKTDPNASHNAAITLRAKQVKIWNNTFYECDETIRVITHPNFGDNEVRNNIFSESGDVIGGDISGVTWSHNLWYNCDSTKSGSGDVSGEDPLLTDPANGDMALGSGSPAIDAGTDVGLEYNGSAPDMGAEESAGWAASISAVSATSNAAMAVARDMSAVISARSSTPRVSMIPPPGNIISDPGRPWRPVIYTRSPVSGLEYRLSDDRNRQWFLHYNSEGSGFGYLTWRLRRRVGFDWPDVGHGYEVTMRKGPFRVLFHGQVTRIMERTGAGGDEIEIWALGWVHVATADVYNHVYCDNRYTEWEATENAGGSYRPDRFDTDTTDRLRFEPKRSVDFAADDYGRLRYTFPFGESATRFVADYDIALPNDWPGTVELRDSAGATLWSYTGTGETGSLDLAASTSSATYFEIRFYCTTAGESTAEDGTVYVEFTGVKAYSVNDIAFDIKTVAEDVLGSVLAGRGHWLSPDTDQIQASGRALVPAYFDRDLAPADILTWCAQFGDANDTPLVWGVVFDETRRLFVQPINTTAVGYVIRAGQSAVLERAGDLSETSQVLYGVYTDEGGEVQRTADQSDAEIIDRLGGYYRRTALQVSATSDATQAANAVALALAENAQPGDEGRFTVEGDLYRSYGLRVPFDEVIPGSLVQVLEWRAHEVRLEPSDFRDRMTSYLLAGVRIDEDARSVELIPRRSSDAFRRYMAIIQELAA